MNRELPDIQTELRKGKGEERKIYPCECRVPNISKERKESLLKRTMQRNGEKQ